MDYFQGIPWGSGVSIAAAARLTEERGALTLSAERLQRLNARLQRFGVDYPEVDQVILVAERLPSADALITVPGIEIVGLAAVDAPGDSAVLPAVRGLPDEFPSLVEEDDIVIVDGDRGRVYVSPDAATIARYQQTFGGARRIVLEGEHIPARTASDGRTIAVLASVENADELETAMRQGADGIWLGPGNALFDPPQGVTGADPVATLRGISHNAAGKTIFLDRITLGLDPAVLAEASAHGPIHVVLDSPSELAEWRDQLAAADESLDLSDRTYGRVQFDTRFDDPETELPPYLPDLSGIVIDDLIAADLETTLPALDLAHASKKNATLIIPDADREIVTPHAVSYGFTRVVVSPGSVLEVKNTIRGL